MDNPDLYLYLKILAASLLGALTIKLNGIGDLLLLFFAAILLDYLTGIAAAIYKKRLSSGIGFRGIIKKLGECFVVAVAFLTDEVIAQIGLQLGLPVSTGGAVAAVVIIWLVLNELISILENIEAMNIALPPFLTAAIKRLKSHTESAGGKLVNEQDEGGAKPSIQETTDTQE